MSGGKNLNLLLRSLSPSLADGIYVFATIADEALPANISPQMIFREAEGTTVILLKSEAEETGLDHDFACRMITLNVHSSLDAVGFMACIANELAREGIPVNPVSGYFHDHLFVPAGRERDAMKILERIASGEIAAARLLTER